MIIIGINYDEGNPFTYRGVMVQGDGIGAVIATGDVEADFATAIGYAKIFNDIILYSSSCDHFVSDGDEYKFKDEYIVKRNAA